MGNALGASEQDGEVYIERTADDAAAYNVVHMTDGTLRRLTAHKSADKKSHPNSADEQHGKGESEHATTAEAQELMSKLAEERRRNSALVEEMARIENDRLLDSAFAENSSKFAPNAEMIKRVAELDARERALHEATMQKVAEQVRSACGSTAVTHLRVQTERVSRRVHAVATGTACADAEHTAMKCYADANAHDKSSLRCASEARLFMQCVSNYRSEMMRKNV